MSDIEDKTDQDLHEEMRALLTAVATRSSANWEDDRQRLDAVITELEIRGYKIDS